LAQTQRELGKVPDCETTLNRLLIVKEPDSDILTQSAVIADSIKLTHLAVGFMRKAIDVGPADAASLVRLSLLEYQLKDFSSAIRELDLALNVNPDDNLILALKAMLLAEVADYPNALLTLQSSLLIGKPSVLNVVNFNLPAEWKENFALMQPNGS